MNTHEKIILNIKTLMGSLRLDFFELNSKNFTKKDRRGVMEHIKFCLNELHRLGNLLK